MKTKLVVATRKSQLALAQARAFLRELERKTGVTTEELLITTTGDRVQDVPLSEVGGKGVFIKEIEEALLDGRADIAVHSLKDVPADLAPSLVIGCVPERADPRDVIVTRGGRPFAELPSGSKVGTSSLRRAVMLRSWRPDLDYVPIRGNVDTRLKKCADGVVDAVVLAHAGLIRLGLESRVTEIIEPEKCLPAIGQGALAIERRANDADVAALLDVLTHPDTAVAVAVERGVMKAVDGSCQIPVAAYAIRETGTLWVRAMIAEPDGSRLRFTEERAPWPDLVAAAEIGEAVGRKLKAG